MGAKSGWRSQGEARRWQDSRSIVGDTGCHRREIGLQQDQSENGWPIKNLCQWGRCFASPCRRIFCQFGNAGSRRLWFERDESVGYGERVSSTSIRYGGQGSTKADGRDSRHRNEKNIGYADLRYV